MENALVLPNGWVPRSWIEDTYREGKQRQAAISASLDKGQINAQIEGLSATPGGIQALADKSRTALLREYLYEGSFRNIFSVYKLTQGELPDFNLDIAVPAAHIGFEGLPQQVEIKAPRYIAETSFYGSNPYARWTMTNRTKYDLLNAIQQRGKASLLLQESVTAWSLIRYSSGLRSGQGNTQGLQGTSAYSQNAAGSVPTTVAGFLSLSQLSQAQANFGARLVDNTPQKLVINPGRVSDLNQLSINTGAGVAMFTPEYNDEMLRKHFAGTVLGMETYRDIVVPSIDNAVYVDSKLQTTTENIIGYIVGGAEVVGVCMIRTDLMIETLKDAGRFSDVFAIWMDTGFLIPWVKALQRLTDAAS